MPPPLDLKKNTGHVINCKLCSNELLWKFHGLRVLIQQQRNELIWVTNHPNPAPTLTLTLTQFVQHERLQTDMHHCCFWCYLSCLILVPRKFTIIYQFKQQTRKHFGWRGQEVQLGIKLSWDPWTPPPCLVSRIMAIRAWIIITLL